MSATKPRAGYCTGCGVTFPKMHLLRNHRNTFRCGGRFLPKDERRVLEVLRLEREEQFRLAREKAKDST